MANNSSHALEKWHNLQKEILEECLFVPIVDGKNKLFTKFIKNSLEPFLTFHSFHQYVLLQNQRR